MILAFQREFTPAIDYINDWLLIKLLSIGQLHYADYTKWTVEAI